MSTDYTLDKLAEFVVAADLGRPSAGRGDAVAAQRA
jgi:hypothetical protein